MVGGNPSESERGFDQNCFNHLKHKCMSGSGPAREEFRSCLERDLLDRFEFVHMSKSNLVDYNDLAGFGAIAEQDYQHLPERSIIWQRRFEHVYVAPPLIGHKSLWTADKVNRANLIIRRAEKF